ncbi:hypothetical protein [Nostoc sp. WHI]|uniref:hypothetical protein n=1 Tax=Nostoc sp. WHI TaxID=2650611 RepID=UPI0018C4C8E5|nr:hypothetical protein [Nostoc sp. WHI]MBG1266791.1 hypothetical protein [Nostoc sp. WHI]
MQKSQVVVDQANGQIILTALGICREAIAIANWHNFWNFKLSPRMKSPHLIGVPPRSQKKKMSQGVRRAIAITTPYRCSDLQL